MEIVSYQVLFNVAVSALGICFGWILKTVSQSVRDLRQADKELTEKVASIEVLVAGNYVTRDELQTSLSSLDKKLDKIFTKLDSKADK